MRACSDPLLALQLLLLSLSARCDVSSLLTLERAHEQRLRRCRRPQFFDNLPFLGPTDPRRRPLAANFPDACVSISSVISIAAPASASRFFGTPGPIVRACRSSQVRAPPGLGPKSQNSKSAGPVMRSEASRMLQTLKLYLGAPLLVHNIPASEAAETALVRVHCA